MIRALFGGSFDPPHNGHLAMIDYLHREHIADVIHVCPAWLSPHKSTSTAPAADRLRLCEIVFEPLAGVEIVPDEVKRGGLSYTIETLRGLVEAYPKDSWRLVVGADNLAVFDSWQRPREIVELARLIVFARGDRPAVLPAEVDGHCDVIAGFDLPFSSTSIREELAAGRRPTDSLPAVVLEHILARGLYGAPEGKNRVTDSG